MKRILLAIIAIIFLFLTIAFASADYGLDSYDCDEEGDCDRHYPRYQPYQSLRYNAPYYNDPYQYPYYRTYQPYYRPPYYTAYRYYQPYPYAFQQPYHRPYPVWYE